MPIVDPNSHSSPVYNPTKNYQIVKYIDLTKFVSILQRESLFFCRLDKLEDHFEGTLSKPTQKMVHDYFSTQHLLSTNFKQLSEEEVIENVKKYFDAQSKRKAIHTVCCWNKSNSESAALWKIYSDFNKGIMLISRVNSIIESFSETEESIDLSEVKYLDYNKEDMPLGNAIFPIIHKHEAYHYEEELRLIHTVEFENGFIYDWSIEEVEQGKYLKVDLNKLIDKIVLSPYSPNWYFKLIENLCETYGLETTIVKSELSKKNTK